MDRINPILKDKLSPLEPYYTNSAVEEIAINRFHEIWVKKKAGDWQAEHCDFLSSGYLKRLIQFIGNLNKVPFDIKTKPIVSTTLPGGHRFQAIWGTNVRYELDDNSGVAICIRRLNKESKITIHDYINNNHDIAVNQSKHNFPIELDNKKIASDIISAINKGKAIMLSGATNTGKTTFIRDLVNYIPENKRVITIEDTREILVPHQNRVSLFVSRTESSNQVGYDEIINSILRLTPDVVIAGEVSQNNTAAIYRLLSSGHGSFITTIHSDSPIAAMHDFHKNLRTQGLRLDFDEVEKTFRRSIAMVIQLGHSGGKRVITDILTPSTMEIKEAFYA